MHATLKSIVKLIGIRFGWVNASYVYGLQMTNAHMRRALGTLTPWEQYAKATSHGVIPEL